MTSTPPLLLLSSMATREMLRELADGFARVAAVPVEARAAGGVDVAKRVRAGEAVDVVVLASKVIDELVAEGVLAGPRVDVVRSGIGIAVRAGAARPAVGTEDQVRDAVLAARTLSYSTGPSGTYLQQMFERWGVLARVRDRIVIPPPGVPVASLVAEGMVELGFQQLSELLNVPGVEVLGPLPSEIQTLTVFSGAVRPGSSAAAASRLLQFLAAPEHAALKQRHGMDAA